MTPDPTPPASPTTEAWTCERCNYMNCVPICTHCGHIPIRRRDYDETVTRLLANIMEQTVTVTELTVALTAARARSAELDREVERLTNILDAVCPSPDSGGGTVSVADQLAAQAEQIAGLRRAMTDSAVILEGLELAVVWELAPEIKKAIAAANVQNRAAVLAAAPAPEPDAKDRRILRLDVTNPECGMR